MNKKFLSAILFGALMATSAGTFVSCKDYDDDIKNLQTQIDTNKTAIAELQKLVGAGNWVTNVAASGESLVVTMSNGTTATIAGIKGADGKDGKDAAEWTIGEDGFWYVNGEKTTNVAVAQNGKDGKNGVSAPSPFIGADGNWVVYAWDAAKGEFVQEATEISAQGTSAYAVKADGVYTLYVADENGEMQEIALPATSDSFVVKTPYQNVNVEFEIATWTKWAATSKKDEGKALLAKYPELAKLEKSAPMKQGGMLPLFVTPANVDLTDGFTFHLQDVYGKVAEIELSNPVKGADLTWSKDLNTLISRSADEASLWSLEVEPAYNAKKKSYATAVKTSLIAENAKGTAARTAFAYTLVPFDYDKNVGVDVQIKTNNGTWSETTPSRSGLGSKAPYAESIDLFAGVLENDGVTVSYPISFEYDYNNHYIIALNDALQAEKYGLSIAEDGHTLNIAKMPASELSIEVELKVVALGLNGSYDSEIVKLTVGQEIAATGVLADKEVTLGYKAGEILNGYGKKVRWNIADLGFTATQLNQFLSSNIKLEGTYLNEDGEEKEIAAITINAYDKKGKTENVTYKNAETFGFDIDSKTWMPNEYAITLTAEKDNVVVYRAEATLTVLNPTTTAVKLVPEFVENGVLQIVGAYNGGKIEYNLNNGIIKDSQVKVLYFEDVDYIEYKEANGTPAADDYDMASENWIKVTSGVDTETQAEVALKEILSINPYNATTAATTPDVSAQLETVRNIRATYCLFGNRLNRETFDFQVIVKSAVYSETPADVVTVTKTALTLPLNDNPATTNVDETKIDIAEITKAVLAYGPNAGKEYKLWNSGGSAAQTGLKKYHNDYDSPKTIKDAEDKFEYVVNANNLMVSIANEDLSAFGYTADEIIKIQSGADNAPLAYIMYNETPATNKVTWKEILDKIYNNVDLTASVKQANGTYKTESVFTKVLAYGSETETITGAYSLNTAAYNAFIANENNDATTIKYLKLFKTYYSSIAYAQIEEIYNVAAVGASGVDYSLLKGEAEVVPVDPTHAAKFISGYDAADKTNTAFQAKLASGVDMTADEVNVDFNIIIKDQWGKTMKVPFTITVKK